VRFGVPGAWIGELCAHGLGAAFVLCPAAFQVRLEPAAYGAAARLEQTLQRAMQGQEPRGRCDPCVLSEDGWQYRKSRAHS
jgi:hypothetical protein